jgi:hypothetical protein
MRPFRTDKGAHIHVFPITITMDTAATFRCVIYSGSSIYDKVFNLEGAEYTNWGASDDYIKHYICDKEGFIGRPAPEVDASGNQIVYERPAPAPAPSPAAYDDNRSVHNEADIARIQSLQEQLDEQAAKLKTITELLFKNGSI